MRDSLYYFLFRLNRISIIAYFYYRYYLIAVWVVKRIILQQDFIKAFYLKGSFRSEHFVPIISDLDFFVCGEKTQINYEKLSILFKKINKFFPMVSDFDFHSERELDYLRSHSGLKFFDTDTWLVLKGDDFGFSYQYHPRKYQVDILHEIYFQLEWLFKNLKKRTGREKYLSACIHRQYHKVVDLLSLLETQVLYKVKRQKFLFNREWIEFSNEEIIIIFMELLSLNEKIIALMSAFKSDFTLMKMNFEDVLEEKYYQENLVFIENGFTYQGKDHYFTKDLFFLFFYVGSLDSYVIFDWANKTSDKIAADFMKSLYYARLIEGRYNTCHGASFFNENINDAYTIKDRIFNLRINVGESHINLLTEDVCVAFVWETEQTERTNVVDFFKSFQENTEDFKLILFEFNCSDLTFEKNNLSNGLDLAHVQMEFNRDFLEVGSQKQAILNILKDWCFGVDVLIYTTPNTFFPQDNWLDRIKGSLQSNDFIIPYEKINFKNTTKNVFITADKSCLPVNDFIWAAKKSTWDKIGKIVDINLDLFSNEIFYYTVTGILLDNYFLRTIFVEEIRSLFSIKYRVSFLKLELRSSAVINERFDWNRQMLKTIFFTYSVLHQKRSQWGLWLLKDINEVWYEVDFFLKKREELACAEINGFLKKFHKYSILNLNEMFLLKLNDYNYGVAYDGAFGVLESSPEGFRLLTGSRMGLKRFEISYRYKLTNVFSSGLYVLEYKMLAEHEEAGDNGEVEFYPNDIAHEYSCDVMEEINAETRMVMIHLDKESRCVDFQFKGILWTDCSYTFSFENIKKANYKFFKKINSRECSDRGISLEGMFRGLYKIVINLNKATTGRVVLRNTNDVIIKEFEFEDETNPVLYVFLSSHKVSYHLVFVDFLVVNIESLDILKQEL